MSNTTMRQWRNILILGAGELGMAMLKGFMKERETHPEIQLTVLVRPSSLSANASPAQKQRLQQLADWQVEAIAADFSEQTPEELAGIFAHYDAVINCSGFVGGKGTQLRITRAVLLAGVKRYFPWQFGVDYDRIGMGSGQPVWDEQLAVRQLLRAQQQTQWVIVSTGMFTSFLFDASFGLVDFSAHTVMALGDANYAITLTTPEDIGLLTAALFFHQPLLKNEVVYLSGDTLTWRELAALLSQHYASPFTLEVKTRRELKVATEAAPEDTAAAYRLAFARAEGVAWPKADTFNARHHFQVTDVRRWLAENKPLS